MKRPDSKDKNINKYIDWLEDTLKAFSSDSSMVKMYLAINRQIKETAELLDKVTPSEDALTDKDDKYFDRVLKIKDTIKKDIENLLFLKEKITPKVVEDFSREFGGSYEKIMNELDNV